MTSAMRNFWVAIRFFVNLPWHNPDSLASLNYMSEIVNVLLSTPVIIPYHIIGVHQAYGGVRDSQLEPESTQQSTLIVMQIHQHFLNCSNMALYPLHCCRQVHTYISCRDIVDDFGIHLQHTTLKIKVNFNATTTTTKLSQYKVHCSRYVFLFPKHRNIKHITVSP